MKKIVLALLSLLVVGMFLVGCAKSGAEGLAGEAVKVQKNVPKINPLSAPIELEYTPYQLIKWKTYKIYNVAPLAYPGMPPFLTDLEYQKYTGAKTKLSEYPGKEYSHELIFVEEISNPSKSPTWNGWMGCTIAIDNQEFNLEMNQHYNLKLANGDNIQINVYGTNTIENKGCFLNYYTFDGS